MTPQIWIAIIGTVLVLGFIINGMRLVRGPQGHAFNAGALHVAMGSAALPIIWIVALMSAL